MIGGLGGPWFVLAAFVMLAVVIARWPRPPLRELWLIAGLSVAATAARLAWGLWGPLHVNGQGPLWIRGALDGVALVGYGPGYHELFGWVTRLGGAPDRAVFAANALLSGLSPLLLYAAARLAGVGRGGALAVALVLAVDVVSIRTAASEGYLSSLIFLVLGVHVALALALRVDVRGDRLAAALALLAAGLLAAAAARIHPMVSLSLALSPLLVLVAAQPDGWRRRCERTAAAAAAIAVVVTLTSGSIVLAALQTSQMTGDAFSGMRWGAGQLLFAALVLAVALHRWIHPPWLPLLAVAALFCLLMTQDSFQQHPLQKLTYQRLYFPGLLLGAAALLPRRRFASAWAIAAAAPVVFLLFQPVQAHLDAPTTEQLEYRFLQETLADMPPGCTLAAVSRAGKRVWEIPSYLIPAGRQRAIVQPSDLSAGAAGACLLYVHASLCSSAEGRGLCDAVEQGARLERVASRVFPAAPSYADLPYDRAEVEVVVFKSASQGAGGSGGKSSGGTVSDGAAITPELAKSLFDQLAPLRTDDGCKMVRFDTSRFRITIGLETAAGVEHALELATAGQTHSGRKAGGWALAASSQLEGDCAATFAAIEAVLAGTAVPRTAPGSTQMLVLGNAGLVLLIASFVLLLLGTAHILYREVRAQAPPLSALLGLALVWAVALGLRLWLSPHTFLHEYYHIAETVSAYQTGTLTPLYGNTGPALFRLVGWLLGSQDVEIIFVTNAVLAALAIVAVALLDLALLGSWPRALCAAVLLCVLPQHLRFSAAEDLFVQAVTFGLWTLALFALYLRTRRLEDALVAALGLSLAMQTRPEMLFFPAVLVAMVLCLAPRAWRVLFAWRTLLALALLAALLIPRFFELQQVLQGGSSPASVLPGFGRYLDRLLFFQPQVTPPLYWVLSLLGLAWGLWRKPGICLWPLLVFAGYTMFSLSIFDNPPYNLRSQLLPTSFLVLIAAGAAPLWIELWGQRRRLAQALGAALLGVMAVWVVVTRHDFVSELRDQQLEWAFLARTVPQLPEKGALLTAVEVGGRSLNAFPQFLLGQANKSYELIDVRRAAAGATAWPAASEHLLYYQGMFCHFAFGDEPEPDPLSRPCRAVHERYDSEPLFIEDLDTQGYSHLRYAAPPFRIGFYRLRPRTP